MTRLPQQPRIALGVLGILISLVTARIGSAQVGACCLPDGSCELIADIEACEILGGAWRAETYECDDDACSEAPCCLTDGTCVIALDFWHCNNFFDGYWHGGESSCTDIVCTESACCLPDGSCLVTNNDYQCTDMGGLFRFPGSVCADCCPADLDGGGRVGFGDLMQLLGAWGRCPECAADLDGNGSVGMPDLSDLLTAWGSCPSG